MNSTVQMAERIELVGIAEIAPYERNPRTHSDRQVDQIAASIVRFGFTNPVLVDSRSGIVAGHGRLLAAKKLGMELVPIIRLDHLSDAERRAYIIVDNKLAENAGWDEELLAAEVSSLDEEGFDIDLLGFDESEIAELLHIEEEVAAAPPQLPDQDPVCRVGDVWQVGDRFVRVQRPTAKISKSGVGFVCEPDPAFADSLIRQLQRLTGCNAILEGDGRNFTEIESVRRF